MAFTLLAVDDHPQDLELIVESLDQKAIRIVTTPDPERGWELFLAERPNLVMTDISMPKLDGFELLRRILSRDPAAEVILTSANYSAESAVVAIKAGAADYITKPIDIENLRKRVSDSIAEWELRSRALQLDRELVQSFQLEGIVGRSVLMLDLFSTIRRIAPHFRTALIRGATGTGKERVARALHQLSPVKERPLATCNCSALAETLFESELFGYVKGAFTGATSDKVGLFEFANGGTVFLDEIGDLPLAGQSKLLRVLQNQEIQKVGSPIPKKIDVRVIAATHRDLKAMVEKGTFREDLYYRLSMVEIEVPTLMERREDLPLLQRHFVEKFSREFNKQVKGLTRRAQHVLANYSWPGNVRELENVIGRACMMTRHNVIDVPDLADYLRGSVDPVPDTTEDVISMQEVERRHALKVLRQFGGNKAKAAEVLGISRNTLYSILGRGEAELDEPERAGA